jgi:nucleotide-binding universal stress UspA family protein
MYRHLLVPVEDTDASIEAIGQATEFAQGIGARITFLYASSASHGESAMRRPTADGRAGELLARAEAGARAQGVPCASVIADGKPPFDAIVAYAHTHGCDLICTASSESGADAPAASEPVPDDASRPAILTCATDRRPATQASICALLTAHRALTASLHEWLDAIRAERERGAIAQEEMMREIVCRLRELPARGVRAGMKASLFRRLRKRTSTVNAELDELERLHRRDEELLDDLLRMIGRNPHAASAEGEFEQAVSAYARFVSEWMGREQGVILPAARRYLSYADWTAINAESSCAGSTGETTNHHDTNSEPHRSRA